MPFKVIPFSDVEAWNLHVQAIPNWDIYYLHNYVDALRVHGDGLPVLIIYSEVGLNGILVAMKRDLADTKMFRGAFQPGSIYDLITPYGYGGWLFDCESMVITDKFIAQFQSFMRENNIVSGFVRYSPILHNAERLRLLGNVVDLGKTIAIDLSSVEVIWANISSKNRNMIRKAQKNGVTIHHSKLNKQRLAQFKVIYDATMARDHAQDYYFFGDAFYCSMLEHLQNFAEIFWAEYENEVIAMSIMLHGNGLMHYHLSGSLAEFRHLAPSNLLLYEAALWGCEQGFRWFHLGGGVGSEEDNLYKFKKQFNRNSNFRFSIGREIYDEEVYRKLVNWRQENDMEFNPYSSFFPLYRS